MTVTDPEDDFAALFEASIKAKRFERGDTIEGTIVAIGPDAAFVNVGGKGEAVIELDELRNEDGVLEVAVGERIHAVVVSTDGGLTLSRKLARSAATARQLEDAYHARLPVEGRVERAVKGGYEVRIARQRAFCPASQIDIARNTNPADHEGHVYTFRIIEYKEGGRNLVVSRRALQEEEQQVRAAELRQTIVPGAIVTGRVASVLDFGAFIELGAGIQGLLHVSEMAWSRVAHASEVVTPGQEITVKVLRVEDEPQRIALGLKQLLADPWSTVPARYEVGQVRPGRITRVAQFGAFVDLGAGIQGLLHVSEMAWSRVAHASEVVTPGQEITVKVLRVEDQPQRIALGLKQLLTDPWSTVPARYEVGQVRPGRITRLAEFGAFVELEPGVEALAHVSTFPPTARPGDWARTVSVGMAGGFEILSLDLEKKRIGVALVLEGAPAGAGSGAASPDQELRDYQARADSESSGGFGSLADKLRGALEPRRK